MSPVARIYRIVFAFVINYALFPILKYNQNTPVIIYFLHLHRYGLHCHTYVRTFGETERKWLFVSCVKYNGNALINKLKQYLATLTNK